MMKSLTTVEFDRFLETDHIVVIVFSADWCQPCHGFKAMMNELAVAHTHIFFGVVDIETEQELSRDFGIRSVPTLMIFREHVALCKESGVMTKQAFLDLLHQAESLNMDEVHQGIAQQLLE